MTAQVLLDPVLQKAGPTLYHAAGALLEPLKNFVGATTHEITIKYVEDFATWKKVAYFVGGVVGGGAIVGGTAYVAGRLHEHSKMKAYMDKRDLERNIPEHEATYIRRRAAPKPPIDLG